MIRLVKDYSPEEGGKRGRLAQAVGDECCRHREEEQPGEYIAEVAADGKDLPGEEQVDPYDEEDGAEEIGGEAKSFEKEFMRDQRPQVSQEVVYFHMGGRQQDGGTVLEYLVLVLFPGEQVRCECNKKEDGQQ